MSYILDALKKSQAEQNSQGVTLAANPAGTKKSRPRGLLTLVILLVATNIGLLLWVTLQRPQSNSSESGAPDSKPATVTSTIQSSPAVASTPITQRPRVQMSATANTTPLVQETAPARQRARTSSVKKVQLSELPPSEQDRFNRFNYSSHIYTDDPELCAIVINGQRLSAGDLFEGMEVVAITEEGVVFGSSRLSSQGQREQLHVAVSVIEQWEK